MARVIQRFWRRTIPKLWVFLAFLSDYPFPRASCTTPTSPPPITPLPPLSPVFAPLSLRDSLRAHIVMTKANHRKTPVVVKLQSRFRGARWVPAQCTGPTSYLRGLLYSQHAI